jgi:hypothetical protein
MRLLRVTLCVSAVTLAAPAAAPAATTISGTLKGGKGFTVNALARDGSLVSAKTGAGGRFSLALKRGARGATLQLVRPNGTYFGPVVLAVKGRRATVGLSGRSAKLGTIVRRGGFATVTAAPKGAAGSQTVDTDANGRPLGAGRLGLIRKAGARAAQGGGGGRGAGPVGADTDGDGVPNPYDADDDGDLVLDSFEQVAPDQSAGLFTTLFLSLGQTVNVNAGSTAAQADAAISGENAFALIFYFDGGAFTGGLRSGHVDCFALVYCRRGDGTAVIGGVSESGPSLPRGARWATYTPDGSGYPNLEPITRGGQTLLAASVQPRVGTAQLRPGDTYNVSLATGSGEQTRSVTLAGYFVTVPAITSWSSGGASGTVAYPAAGAPGDGRGNPIALGSDQLTLTFWRPQRPAIPGAETGGYRDIGGLNYGVVARGEGVSREASCAGLYTGLSPTLSEQPSRGVFSDDGATLFPLRDGAPDAAPSAGSTLSFTVDLGACLRRAGGGQPGSVVELTLTAAGAQRQGGQDRAAQTIAVKLPG